MVSCKKVAVEVKHKTANPVRRYSAEVDAEIRDYVGKTLFDDTYILRHR